MAGDASNTRITTDPAQTSLCKTCIGGSPKVHAWWISGWRRQRQERFKGLAKSEPCVDQTVNFRRPRSADIRCVPANAVLRDLTLFMNNHSPVTRCGVTSIIM